MVTTLEPIPMAKEKSSRQPAKIDTDILENARIVAAFRKQDLAEYLSERLRSLVEEDLASEMSRRAAESPSRPRRKPSAEQS